MMINVLLKTGITTLLVIISLSLHAKQLVVFKKGEAKYVIQDKQIVNLSLKSGYRLKGIMMILTDSTIHIKEQVIKLSNIDGIQVRKENRAGIGVGVVGLLGGTSLIIMGNSEMSKGGIDGIFSGITGLIAMGAGLAIDAVGLVAIALSSGKWIYINGSQSKYQLAIL